MQTIALENLDTVTGGIDFNMAAQCAVDTGRNYGNIGTVAGAVAGGIATGGAGIVPGGVTGRAVGTGLGWFSGLFSSVVSQAFGGSPCPTAPAAPTS